MTVDGFTPDVFGARTGTKYTRLYNNQFFDYLSEQLPKDHKQMMQWCEVVYHSSPALVNGIKKLISYPITDLKYETKSASIRKRTEELLMEHLDIISHLIQVGLDYYVYGNAFRGIYYPFVRNLECKYCQTKTNIKHSDYELRKGKFVLKKCSNCGRKGVAEINDTFNFNPEGIKLISWDPKQIELLSNPITADTSYYYTLPPTLKQGLAKGEEVMAATLPSVFLDAFAQNKQIRFNDNFYHLRTPSVAGYASGWGVPHLAPALKLFLYNSILRKSVEAISMEHITPQRILYPQGTSSDPSLMSSLGKWKEQVQKAIERWRMDPNYVMMAPYPTGVANVGSQGRNLMPTAEIKQVDQDMLLALDIPIEFVYGGLKLDTGSVALRVLENQLRPYVSQLGKYINWIVDNINAKYDKDYCHVKLGDFTLADDLMKRQLLISMAGQGASMSTVQESLGLDPNDENDKLVDDSIKQYERQKKIETETRKIDENILNRAEEKSQADADGTLPSYDQQKLVAAAQMRAQELLSVPYEERRSLLAQLSNEDYVMYALVSAQMESMRNAMDNLE